MTEQQARQIIIKRVEVTRQRIVFAKGYIARNCKQNTNEMLEAFLDSVVAHRPDTVTIHDAFEADIAAKAVADSISWRVAFGEAIWQLIHGGVLFPNSNSESEVVPQIKWNWGGTSSSWRFEEFAVSVPSRVFLAPSQKQIGYQPLSDPDLFLHELNIRELSPEIEAALKEAVLCFRHDLYVACLAMLGKATEGAWIELGIALANVISESDKWRSDKVDEMLSPFNGVGKKIFEVLKIYEDERLPKSVRARSHVSKADLRNAVVWADAVRESRNSIHYMAEAPMTNAYEKVAALLIGAVPHIRLIYNAKRCAEELIKQPAIAQQP